MAGPANKLTKIQTELPLPGVTPIERLSRPFEEFARLESSGGILLIGCTIAALLWANSPWSESYFHVWHAKLTFGFARASLSKELHFWINDGLMALFFLLVGLEIKREVLIGELASLRKAALPLFGALGGMVIPAALYFLFNQSGPGADGWGVPMATDIAFALGVLALLGSGVPTSLKVFLAALAIADDIGAVLVIAFFYTEQVSRISLAVAAGFFVALLAINRMGVRNSMAYVILGIGLWLAFLQSGVHATVAGVLLALTIPSHRRIDGPAFLERSGKILQEFRQADESRTSWKRARREARRLRSWRRIVIARKRRCCVSSTRSRRGSSTRLCRFSRSRMREFISGATRSRSSLVQSVSACLRTRSRQTDRDCFVRLAGGAGRSGRASGKRGLATNHRGGDAEWNRIHDVTVHCEPGVRIRR